MRAIPSMEEGRNLNSIVLFVSTVVSAWETRLKALFCNGLAYCALLTSRPLRCVIVQTCVEMMGSFVMLMPIKGIATL